MAYSSGERVHPHDPTTTGMYMESVNRLKRFSVMDVEQITGMDGVALVFDGIGASLQTFVTRNGSLRQLRNGGTEHRLEKDYKYNALASVAGPSLITITRFSGQRSSRVPFSHVSIPVSGSLVGEVAFGAVMKNKKGNWREADAKSMGTKVPDVQFYLHTMQRGVQVLLHEGIPATLDEALPPLVVTKVRK